MTKNLLNSSFRSLKGEKVTERINKYRGNLTTILLSFSLIAAAVFLWIYMEGNPLREFVLIQKADTITSFLVNHYKAGKENMKNPSEAEIGIYSFRIPDGRKFEITRTFPPPLLKEKLLVEYLAEDPTINRVKGEGCKTITELIWKKGVLGGLFLLILISPGIFLFKNEIRILINKKALKKTLIN